VCDTCEIHAAYHNEFCNGRVQLVVCFYGGGEIYLCRDCAKKHYPRSTNEYEIRKIKDWKAMISNPPPDHIGESNKMVERK